MPTNLNALIRYKQIDRELNNLYLKTTIKSLQEACSKQLAEHRGIYKLISERTIRDDIRVMRSEALGFNAPIIVEGGIYSYSDSEYSIFNSKIERLDILKEVLNLLIEERNQIKNPKLEGVMDKLLELTGIELTKEEEVNKLEISYLKEEISLDLMMKKGQMSYSIKRREEQDFLWKAVLNSI